MHCGPIHIYNYVFIVRRSSNLTEIDQDDFGFSRSLRWSFTEALLGGVYAPCSLWYFAPFSMLPFIFRRSLLSHNFHCSFRIFLCFLLLFNFFSFFLIISLAPCSISLFLLLPTPFSKLLCSLLRDYIFLAPFFILGHAPGSIWAQGPSSLLPDHP